MMNFTNWLLLQPMQSIPGDYWNVHSEEERIKNIQLDLEDIGDYLDYLSEGNQDMSDDIDLIKIDIKKLFDTSSFQGKLKDVKLDKNKPMLTLTYFDDTSKNIEFIGDGVSIVSNNGNIEFKVSGGGSGGISPSDLENVRLQLDTKITTEATRAKNQEGAINDKLVIETNRAKIAEAKLQQNIDNIPSGGGADLKDYAKVLDLNKEVTRAQAAETTLQKNIDNISSVGVRGYATSEELEIEVARAKTEENLLKDKVDSIQLNIPKLATKDEISVFAKSEYLDIEVTRAKAAEISTGTAIGNEIGRAKAAEEALSAEIKLEPIRAKAAEEALKLITDGLESTDKVLISEIKKVDDDIRQDSFQYKAGIDAKVEAIEGNIGTLHDIVGAIDTSSFTSKTTLNEEIDRAKAEEVRLDGKIDENAVNISSRATTEKLNEETNRAKIAEAKLQQNIDNIPSGGGADLKDYAKVLDLNNEVTRAKAEEVRLDGKINAIDTSTYAKKDELLSETQRATKSESTINNAVTNEVTRAKAEENKKINKTSNVTSIEFFTTEALAKAAGAGVIAFYTEVE